MAARPTSPTVVQLLLLNVPFGGGSVFLLQVLCLNGNQFFRSGGSQVEWKCEGNPTSQNSRENGMVEELVRRPPLFRQGTMKVFWEYLTAI